MDSFVFWLALIILCSVILAVLGRYIFTARGAYTLKIDDIEPSDQDFSILGWLRLGWQKVKQGEFPIVQADQPDQVAPLVINSETTGIDPGEESLPGQDSQVSIYNVYLSLDVPAGRQVLVNITTPQNPSEVPAIDIQDQNLAGEAHVRVQVVSSRLIAPIPLQPFQVTTPASRQSPKLVDSLASFWRRIPLATILFVFSALVYLATRVIGLDRFPIYFFTDEAVHTILAEDLVKNQFHFNGNFLPTYFPMGASFGLNSISVYLQAIPYLLFGKSVFVTRLVSVIITLLGAIAVGGILKDFFKLRYWWMGILLLAITPVWFLHSRTAFEYAELAAFYAIFLYFYLSYLKRSPNFLFLAILAGALAFYTHGLGQFLMGITAIMLFISDLPYHIRHWRTTLPGLLFILLLLVPFFRFNHANPSILEEQMRMRGSYWLDQSINLPGKLARFVREYLTGLNPVYWFIPDNPRDLVRHTMKGYGHLWMITLPFFLSGIWLVIKNIKSQAHRVILIAILASPFGAALAQVSVLRVLWFVIPASIVTALGVESFVNWLGKKSPASAKLALGLFSVLTALSFFMLQDALRNGPTWYADYSLYGMQYGAKQLFGEAIPAYLRQDPDAKIIVTPTWANGTDNFIRFFLDSADQARVRLDSIQAYLFEKLPIDDHTLVVLTRPELDEAIASQKFKSVAPVGVINYPDGSPGFYFTHLAYTDNADEIFAAEKLARSQPLLGEISVDDQQVKIQYSRTDMGQPESLFDGDTHTLIRGLEANPFIIELEFPEPRTVSKIAADFANMDFTLSVNVFETDDSSPVVYQQTLQGATGDPQIELLLNRGPVQVKKLRLEILSLNGGERPHIHIRELKLYP
jgi:4-amino-4-deoxy-L-arabinose transferase-like glycosyltransferase